MPEITDTQRLCPHNQVDYRIETVGHNQAVECLLKIEPVCRECGILMNMSDPVFSENGTRLTLRFVPGKSAAQYR